MSPSGALHVLKECICRVHELDAKAVTSDVKISVHDKEIILDVQAERKATENGRATLDLNRVDDLVGELVLP
jgi:hypothetical protein